MTPGEINEDCKWIDMEDPQDVTHDKDGKPTIHRTHAAPIEPPPRDPNDKNKLRDGIRIICPGDPPLGSDWGTVEEQEWTDGGCHYWLCDEMGWPVQLAPPLEVVVVFVGRIVDVCHKDAVKATEFFVVQIEKDAGSWQYGMGLNQVEAGPVESTIPGKGDVRDKTDDSGCK